MNEKELNDTENNDDFEIGDDDFTFSEQVESVEENVTSTDERNETDSPSKISSPVVSPIHTPSRSTKNSPCHSPSSVYSTTHVQSAQSSPGSKQAVSPDQTNDSQGEEENTKQGDREEISSTEVKSKPTTSPQDKISKTNTKFDNHIPGPINIEKFKKKKNLKMSHTSIEKSVIEETWEAVFPETSSTAEQNNALMKSDDEMNDNSDTINTLTESEMELCQIIDTAYDRSIESLNILLSSKYASFRQSAFISILFFAVYLIFGTLFYTKQAGTNWDTSNALLFSIYTITTVGYGNHFIPTTAGFQIFTIFYILVGIAALTIAVAQAYSWVALEAARAQYTRDKAEIQEKSQKKATIDSQEVEDPSYLRSSLRYMMEFSEMNPEKRDSVEVYANMADGGYDQAKDFLRNTSLGRFLSIFFNLGFLVLIGAVVVAPIEGWTFLEGVYWAVVTLTTVGFGHYYPTRSASIWFCIFYLPLSIGFMSYFLSNVAKFYIHMNNSNIQRIQKRMWKKLLKQKQKEDDAHKSSAKSQQNDEEGEDDDDLDGMNDFTFGAEGIPQDRKKKSSKDMPAGYDTVSAEAERNSNSQSWFSNTETILSASTIQDGLRRREKVLELQQMSYTSSNNEMKSYDSNESQDSKNNKKMTTMQDVINGLKLRNKQDNDERNTELSKSVVSSIYNKDNDESRNEAVLEKRTESKFPPLFPLSERQQLRKPSFHLRVMVQERMAHIIANDIAGYQSMVETQENTLSVFIETFKSTADKWMIPKKVRNAFQSVAFQALFFVGERHLIVHGVDALLDLGPLEFHSLFTAPLAAMGDAETMEAWLSCTDVLSDVEFKKGIKGVEAKRGQLAKNIDPNSLPRVVMQPQEKKLGRFNRRRKKTSPKADSSLEQDERFEIV